MKVYIAGPISGLDYAEATQNCLNAAERLRQLGHEPVNPMEKNGLDGDGKEHPWAEYMRRDIPHLLECEAICLLVGWNTSRGAKLEAHIAKELGLLTMYDTSHAGRTTTWFQEK